MKKKLLFGLSISALCMYLVFRHIDLIAFRKSLTEVRYLYLLPVLISILLFTFFRALRWKYLLAPVKKISTANLFEVTMIGYLANNVLPARIGDVVRALVLSKTERISGAASLATVVTERFFDIITLLFIMIIASRHLPLAGGAGNNALVLAGGLFCLLFVFLLSIRYQQDRFFRFSHKILDPISKKMADQAQKSIQAFVYGLQVLEWRGHLVAVSLLSITVGLSMGGIYYFTALAFGINLTFWRLLLLISVTFLGIMIPSSPGFIGTFHYFCVQGLLLGGMKNKNLALSYAIVAHLIQYIPESLAGLFFLWKKGLSFREINSTNVQIEAVH